ncbi:hypothetical protein FLA105534_02045 [Flavobacterium bizetiae]|uniref:Type I restriction modification DNA specificity domain-containing protein n=1 Tax=Flavobacterium bizetiae TaxID=2704140 RepID=A0A6J4GJN4_9FLAO|nr:restriction endonuclease subunit S [Flavobacterium bizetiae]CAA9198269.1 hypothetical protein FLA105534_02045 [Flavobacterium bizetiae]CAD5343550.1 hypothetical protein FLA105535_03549 [Flavobacterium bizetiae]CAD5349544.1 hypothetical protein FLA105534_03529 [Flavobacterium bizetiae]
MKKYDNYKDSGIDWIGNIPSGWSCTKLKFHTKKIIDGAHFTPTYIEKSKDSIPFLRVTDLHSKEILLDEVKYIPLSEHQELIKRCNPEIGDLLLSKNGTIGLMKIIDWDWEFSIFVSLCLLKFEKTLLNKFFYYFFESNIVDRQLFESSQKTSVSNLHLEKIKELRLTLPSINEQLNISNYLDHKTAQIDTLIAKKEQFISLLQEERTVVINQAVTKGLDPKVKMKDSGIEWLGEIPEHWELKKLKYLCQIISEKSSDKPDYVLALENIKSWTGEIVGNPYENKMEGDVNLFKENDILFNKLRPYLAKVIKTETDGGCVGELLVLRANHFLTPTFLYYRMISEAIITIVDNSTYGTKMPRASWDKFISLIGVGFPTIDEQNQITNYISRKISDISSLISKAEQEIELLKEYKTALISEVVTGKVDVRDVILN